MIGALVRGLGRAVLPALQLAAAGAAIWTIWNLTRSEQTLEGRGAVFLLLALPLAAALVWSARSFSIAAVTILVGFGLPYIDRLKYSYFYEHVHVIDLVALFEYVKAGSLVIVWQYQDLILFGAKIAAACIVAFILLRVLESFLFRRFPHYRGARLAGAILALVALVNAAIFLNGAYFWSISNQYVYGRMKKTGPFIVSHGLASFVDYAEVLRQSGPTGPRDAVKLAADRADGPICQNCPDIILVHLESVFDPKITAPYRDGPSLAERLNPRLVSENGDLMTRVFGGYSMISEFNVNCGVDHRLFGIAGQFPNLFLSRGISRCGPGYLRDNGYETSTVSSVIPHIMRYGEAYSSYGVSDYHAPGTMNIPTNWVEMRDGAFVDATISLLNKPAAHPRFILILTVFNHGPHGKWPGIERNQIFSGPYDLAPVAGDEMFHDYMNRLNDTVSAFRRLEDYIETTKRPTMIVYYGDHHAAFPKTISPAAEAAFGARARYVTPYRMARNFAVAPAPAKPEEPLPIERLFARALEFGGVRPSPEQRLALEASRPCPDEQIKCDAGRRLVLHDLLFRAGQEAGAVRSMTK